MTAGVEIAVEDAHRRLAAGDVLGVDVREQDEWDAGHVTGALHVPLGSLAERAASLDRSRPIVAICRSGARSAQATGYLAALGFDVLNLAGGMKAWHAVGLPLEPADGHIA